MEPTMFLEAAVEGFLPPAQELLAGNLCVLFAFLLGSVLFCRFLPSVLLKKDICAMSRDRNPGAANVFSHCGVAMGLLCLCLDVGKGFFPVFVGGQVMKTTSFWYTALMVAPVLGHAVAPFDHFHGGKCIATSFGVMFAMAPRYPVGIIALASAYIFFSTVVPIRSHRRRSIAAFLVYGAVSAGWLLRQGADPAALGCVLIALIAVAQHLRDKSDEPVSGNAGGLPPETDPVPEAVCPDETALEGAEAAGELLTEEALPEEAP